MDLDIMPPTEQTGINPAEKLRRLLASDEPYATTLLVLALDKWGTACLEWHPQTLKMEMEETFGARLPKANVDRLMAAVSIVTNDFFFKSLPRFIQLSAILAGDSFDPDTFEPADVAECAWAINEALLLSPPEGDEADTLFCPEIRYYLGKILRDEGFLTPPDVLRLAVGNDAPPAVDDPRLAEEIRRNQADKNQEITTLIRDNFAELVEQLRALPLENGTTADLEKRFQALVRRNNRLEETTHGPSAR